MAKTHYWRGKFDPAWDFTASKPMTVGGVEFTPGALFDKTKVTTRRLKQLFQARKIARIVGDDIEDVKDTAHRENVRRLLIEAGVAPTNIDDDFLQTVADTADGMTDDEIRSVIAAVGIADEDDDEISEEDEAALMSQMTEAREALEGIDAVHSRFTALRAARAAGTERVSGGPDGSGATDVAATGASPAPGASPGTSVTTKRAPRRGR